MRETVDVSPDARALAREWAEGERWNGVERPYTATDVLQLRGSYRVSHTIATLGAERLWHLLKANAPVITMGALAGQQAVQLVRAGLQAVYCSGWMVAAESNLARETYSDQGLYPANSGPALVERINNALLRADQIEAVNGSRTRHWLAPVVADAEAGFGGLLNAYETTKAFIKAGVAAVHLEDQSSVDKKCGRVSGKVLVPTSHFVEKLVAARLAADVLDVSTLIVARTDALTADLLSSDIDAADRPFFDDARTSEGHYAFRPGLDAAIARGLAAAPYADLLWCEATNPNLSDAREFAEGIHRRYPGKLLAYNCTIEDDWADGRSDSDIASFQRDLAEMGYAFQFLTIAGFHTMNAAQFELAADYIGEGMTAWVRHQQHEQELSRRGYTSHQFQDEVGTEYFDAVLRTIAGSR